MLNLIFLLGIAKHHTSHAAYGYYTQDKPNATIMCLDSIGEFETFTIWHGGEQHAKEDTQSRLST